MNTKLVPLEGSKKEPLKQASAKKATSFDPDSSIEITIFVRRGKDSMESSKEDIDAVKEYAEQQGLDAVDADPVRHTVVIKGPAGKMMDAFNVHLQAHVDKSGQEYRTREGMIHIPEHLKDIIEGVFGFDDRPQAVPHFRLEKGSQKKMLLEPRAAQTYFTPPELAATYRFPKQVTGKGQRVAIIELGGGYHKKDLDTYFKKLKISKPPKITDVSVDGAKNAPEGDPNSADGEVVMDIEIVASVATAAEIVVYFAPNSDRGFLDAISSAVYSKKYKPNAVSISWGASETNFTEQSKRVYESVFADAAALGINVFCASGDDGSSDGQTDGMVHVDFPGSAPHAVSCGGTTFIRTGRGAPKEIVWNNGVGKGATGGGISDFFAVPEWQKKIKLPASANGRRKGRGVPDVAGVADPKTGYLIYLYGKDYVFGGTSAVSPLWAALVVLLNEALKSDVGFLLPRIYKGFVDGEQLLHDIVEGNNGAYLAQKGWDACSGLGTPNGDFLATYLKQ